MRWERGRERPLWDDGTHGGAEGDLLLPWQKASVGFFSLVALHGREGVRCTCMSLCRVAGPSRDGSSLLSSARLRRLVVCSAITVSRGRVDPARCPERKGLLRRVEGR